MLKDYIRQYEEAAETGNKAAMKRIERELGIKGMANKKAELVEIKKECGGICLVCNHKMKPSKLMRIRRENGDSIISFNVCRDCLRRLTLSMAGALYDFDGNLNDRKGDEDVAYRGNRRLNKAIEEHINIWSGTLHSEKIKNMYKSGVAYEDICQEARIDYENYKED